MAKMDLPPEFVFGSPSNSTPSVQVASTATTSKRSSLPSSPLTTNAFSSYHHGSSGSSEEIEPDDAARSEEYSHSPTDREKLKRKVTFANEPALPEGEEDDSDDEPEEDKQQRYMKLRYKRSASLPSIELNRELARKIRRMLKDEERTEDDFLHNQLTDLKLSQELDKSNSEIKYEYEFAHGHLLQVRLGDITEESVDIIVNEANSNLTHNSGTAAALAQKGGKEVQVQSDRWVRKHGPVPPGQVAVTEAGQLPCKWLIHAVGPVWRGGNWREDSELWDAMWNCLVWSSKLHARSIAIPAVGSSFLGFQKERCAYLLVDCIAKFVHKHPLSKLREIRIVNPPQNPDVTDAVVFEVVGKFTSGCDTSESERSSDYEDDEAEDEEGVEDFNEEDNADAAVAAAAAAAANSSVLIAPVPTVNRWLPVWRRQSIA